LIRPAIALVLLAPLFLSASDQDEGYASKEAPSAAVSHGSPSPRAADVGGGGGVGELKEGGSVGPDGKEVACDLPVVLRKKNIGSPPPNGPGCCVFRSAECAGDYQNVPAVNDFAEWMVQNRIEGGGYPAKVDKLIPQIAKSRGLPTPAYVQHEGGDPDFLWACIRTGRMPCITYDGRDMHYGRNQRVAHMVNLVSMSGPPGTPNNWYAVMDNNFVGENQLVWLTEEDFLSRWRGMGGGWAFAFLAPPPMPVPRN
jgi:hypothetical protein